MLQHHLREVSLNHAEGLRKRMERLEPTRATSSATELDAVARPPWFRVEPSG